MLARDLMSQVMTRERKVWLSMTAVFAVTVIGAFVARWWASLPISESQINAENARQIKLAMPRAEVERLLGGPPRFDDGLKLEEDASWNGTGYWSMYVKHENSRSRHFRAIEAYWQMDDHPLRCEGSISFEKGAS